MDELIVDFSVLKELASSIVDHIDATDSSLDELDGIVKDLEATWTGLGRDAFHDAITQWFASARDLRDQLHWIRDVVTTAHDNHAGAVKTNVTIWRV